MGNYIVKATQMEESKQKEMEKFLKYKNEPYMKHVNLYKYKFIPNLKKIIE
tara:strand:+ start:228 stop:380 length:153 start_codon:yes stop_codon:yes gene_type:complete